MIIIICSILGLVLASVFLRGAAVIGVGLVKVSGRSFLLLFALGVILTVL